jgi:hypothetical protein
LSDALIANAHFGYVLISMYRFFIRCVASVVLAGPSLRRWARQLLFAVFSLAVRKKVICW